MRIAVLHNVDYQCYAAGAPSYEADAEVRETAEAVASILARNGHWSTIVTVEDRLDALIPNLHALNVDLVFNLVESLGGEASREPELPSLLESAGIPYTGNSAEVLRIAHAKDATREILARHGVPIPGGVVVDRSHPPGDPASIGLGFPLFLKPARTDASIGIDQGSIVRDQHELGERYEWLCDHFPEPFLVEEYLPGKEVNVAIFPEPIQGQLVCTEIDFSLCPPEVAPIVTYDCKWRPGTPDYQARSVPCRGRLTEEELREAQRIAHAAFLAIGGTSYGRVDLRIGAGGRFYVIDVNPNPDLHPDAGLSIAARSVGFEHDALVMTLMEAARSRAHHASQSHTPEGSGAARSAPLPY